MYHSGICTFKSALFWRLVKTLPPDLWDKFICTENVTVLFYTLYYGNSCFMSLNGGGGKNPLYLCNMEKVALSLQDFNTSGVREQD